MRVFDGFPSAEYIGAPFTRAISLRGISGQCVPLKLNWIAYGAGSSLPALLVNVNLDVALVAQRMATIKSIYIDNMGSAVPIYVICPDTGYIVVARPNSAGWFCVYTNAMQLQIAGIGFLDGSVPTTLIIACNIDQIPSVDLEIAQSVALWKASASITRGGTIYNQNLGTPALGDQTQQITVQSAAPGVLASPLFGGPQSGFIYLTAIDVRVLITTGGTIAVNCVLESTGITGILYTFNFFYNADYPGPPVALLAKSGMNVKLDATQLWRIRCQSQSPATTFTFQTVLDWTNNPT